MENPIMIGIFFLCGWPLLAFSFGFWLRGMRDQNRLPKVVWPKREVSRPEVSRPGEAVEF